MININKLTEEDVGRYVYYYNSVGNKEPGRIKSWNRNWIFIVYNCGDEWENFEDYTAAATKPSDLEFQSLERWDISRFDLIDLD